MNVLRMILKAGLSHRQGYFLFQTGGKQTKTSGPTESLLLLKGRTISQSLNFRFLNGIFRSIYFRDQQKIILLFETEQYCTHTYKQQYCIRYRLEPYVATRSLQSKLGKSQRLTVVSSELWYCVCLPLRRQKSFYSTDFPCCSKFDFNTTDYCTLELAPATKVTQYFCNL